MEQAYQEISAAGEVKYFGLRFTSLREQQATGLFPVRDEVERSA